MPMISVVAHSGRKAGLLSIFLATALAFGVAGPASSLANYPVIQCVPNQVGAPAAVASSSGTPKIYQDNECIGGRWSGGAGLSLESNGSSDQGEWRGWDFTAPAGTVFASASASVHQRADNGYGGLYSSGSGTFGFGGEWNSPSAVNTPYFRVSLHCFAAECNSPGGAGDLNLQGAFAFVTHFAASVQDLHAPAVAASGELLDGGVVRGRQDLSLSATDTGGGARSVILYVNEAASRVAGPFCSPGYGSYYTAFKPCPSGWDGNITVDTERDPGWASGPNDVRICAYDVGGNESSCVRRTVTIDNSCPSSGGVAAAKLESGLDVGGQLRARASLRSTESPVIRGTLRNGGGSPVQGATVCVYETVDLPDGSRQLSTIATTQGNGRFAAKLDSGPSRNLDVVYRYNNEILEQEAEIDSTVVPTLALRKKRVRNGQPARFIGRIPGPNADSRAISLQARAGRKWRTFKQLKTDSGGRFRGKYRFTQTTGVARYAFRVLVKRQGGYPYEPGRSAKRKIVVRG